MQHLLVAEDDADLRELLDLTFARAGYAVETATDGVNALKLARRRPPRLVITDLRMPQMDGVELIKALRSDDKLAAVPVILYTAFMHEDPRVTEARNNGAEVLLKQGSLRPLRQLVDRLLSR